jgi:penicillin amidase
MALARYMVWNMSGCWHLEIPLMQIEEKVGMDAMKEIHPTYPEGNPTVIAGLPDVNEFDENGVLKAIKGPFLRKGGASNSWTITPSSSSTLGAVHCNDMHLELSVPAIWYFNHLIVEGELNSIGVSLPGLPLVLVGHNDCFSWGTTLARADGEDIFLERVEGEKYEYKGEWKDLQIVEEVINIKAKGSHTEKIQFTSHGPILSKSLNEDKALAYQGKSLIPSTVLMGYYKINTGKNWNDFVEAMSTFTAPQLNMSYADKFGNHGWYVAGEIPIRAKDIGTTPTPGWTGENEWVDRIPFEEMPHAFNPKSGFIVTCNNKIAPDDYPYMLSGVTMNGYRAKRCTEVIKEKGIMKFPEDHMALQQDVKCYAAKDIIEAISEYSNSDENILYMLTSMRKWDYNLKTDSTPALFYEVLKQHLNQTIFLPILGEELTEKYLGVGYIPVLASISDMYGGDGPILVKLLNNPDSWWINQNGGKNEVLNRAFHASVEWLISKFKRNWKTATWGEAHKVSIAHAMAIKKPMGEVFNVPNLEGKSIGGDTDTPNATAVNPAHPYNLEFHAASYRQIVNCANFENSYFIYPTGQSGHLASPHYSDMFEMWRTGKYLKMNWSDEQIENDKESELVLNPTN